MKKINALVPGVVLVLFIYLIVSYFFDKDRNESELYRNRSGIVVKYNSDQTLTQDKFYTPVTCGNVLVRDLIDSTLYVEMSTCDRYRIINKEWYYNHKVGDTVHFKYIRRDRYFKIK